jgi:hypothetical protein
MPCAYGAIVSTLEQPRETVKHPNSELGVDFILAEAARMFDRSLTATGKAHFISTSQFFLAP